MLDKFQCFIEDEEGRKIKNELMNNFDKKGLSNTKQYLFVIQHNTQLIL